MKSFKSFLALACFLSLLFALTAAQAMFSDTFGATVFAPDDMSVNELKLYTTKEEALNMFGASDTKESFTWDATGETFEMWIYEDLTLTFNAEGEVISALVYGKQYKGPRGVQVGQPAADVVKLFYVDPAMTSTESGIFYTAGYVDTLDAQLPPCGYVERNEDGTFSFNYVAPVTPFGDDVLNDPTNYIYQELAQFQVNFGADALVTDFNWSVGALAE